LQNRLRQALAEKHELRQALVERDQRLADMKQALARTEKEIKARPARFLHFVSFEFFYSFFFRFT
jgi:predicted  nucleic acid-binding Zn-ribbon protein